MDSKDSDKSKRHTMQIDGELTGDPHDRHPFHRKQQRVIGYSDDLKPLDLTKKVLQQHETELDELSLKLEDLVKKFKEKENKLPKP